MPQVVSSSADCDPNVGHCVLEYLNYGDGQMTVVESECQGAHGCYDEIIDETKEAQVWPGYRVVICCE